MGSGTSRGKKVAPACVSEVNAAKTASSVTSSKAASRPRKPLKIHAVLRNERNRAQPPGCHSDGRDSDFSAEDDEGDADAVADVEKRAGNPPLRKMKSRTYGLCHFRQDAEDASERAEGPRGSRGGSRDVNNRSDGAFTHFKKHTTECPSLSDSSTQGLRLTGTLLEAVPTSDKQSCSHSSSLTMPVILYDGSEEELMDTIEKEFS